MTGFRQFAIANIYVSSIAPNTLHVPSPCPTTIPAAAISAAAIPAASPPPPVASQDHATRQEHRAYIRDEVRFKQVVPFSDDKVLPRIHLNFRIAFLRDALLPQDLEDATW